MFGRKAQVATEYLIITAFILVIVTMIFTYSYVTNNENIKVSQANNALDKLINKADLVYALGPDNNKFVEVTFPRGIEALQDITICNDPGQGHNQDCTDFDGVKAGALEMQVSLVAGTSSIKRPAKAEIELNIYGPDGPDPEDLPDPDKRITATDGTASEGTYRIKVFWCGEKICLERA